MKLFQVVHRSINNGIHYRQCNRSLSAWSGFTDQFSGSDNKSNSAESADDPEKRIFSESEDKTNPIFQAYAKIQNSPYGPPGMGDDNPLFSLTDGMDENLKQAATYFEVDPTEIAADDYTYRHDMNLKPRMTYTPEDLNIRKPGVWKPSKRPEFEVTTREVLENADFRNVRFLANFLTEAGLLVKRSKTGISAKAQRKIAREIKTARAFGLLPFTSMGTKAFEVGRTMEDLEQDYEIDPYENPSFVDDAPDSIAE